MSPFAELVLNGAKRLESRQSPFLCEAEGAVLVLRAGHRAWQGPDWRPIVRRYFSEETAAAVTSVPEGVQCKPGDLVGVVRVGRTRSAREWIEVSVRTQSHSLRSSTCAL
eukprot:2216981-Pleurochrysis_carterae.AAC.2